jgi:hypothetical protein
MDEKHVLLTRRQFEELPEYSSSMPSGVYPGKCWKRCEGRKLGPGENPWAIKPPFTWYLVWYGIHEDPKRCTIEHREIRIGKLK